MEKQFIMEEPERKLQEMYIAEYLHGKGYTLEQVHRLPEAEAKELMTEANIYAATKLAEVEQRARIVHEIHGTVTSE